MKLSSLVNRLAAAAVVASAGFASSAYLFAQTTAPADTAPAATQGSTRVLAVINETPIDSEKFEALLMSIAGMRLLEQVIDLMVAEQACRQAGIPVDSPEFVQQNVQAELDRALNELAAQGIEEKLRGQALAQILQRQGITNQEFQMGLRRAACLRALSKGKVTVTDTDLKKVFDAEYGERVRGRLFVVTRLEDAMEIRKMIVDQKLDPSEVAQQRGLQLQQITIAKSAEGEQIKTLRDVAFNMQEKTLSASLPQPERGFLLFYLDKKEPAKTDKFDDVKEKLRVRVTEQAERQWGQNHLATLRRMANIRINDPILSNQYADLIRRMNAAASQPATAPATAPAPK